MAETDKTQIDPVIGGFIADAGIAGIQAITRGGPRRQYKWNKKAAEDSNRMNRENQQWLLAQNKELRDEQRAYDLAQNSPQAQMERFIAAGLNPHLIYGNGSSAGTGVFPIDAGTISGSNIQAPNAQWPDISGSFLRAGQTMAQTELIAQKTAESEMRTQSMEVQNEIARTNPMLNPQVASWVSTAMQETARLKAMESRQWMAKDSETQTKKYQAKINSEVNQMAQRLGLNTADLAIKNKIFESKEFENAIKQINADWLQDGDMSPEHVRQGLMLILSKMMGK